MAQSLIFWHVVSEVKLPTVTGRKGDTNRATARPRCRVGRKHEVEPAYGANSEPTIWHRGAGRADSSERDPISGEAPRCEVGRDVGRRCALPREALLLWRRSRNGGARKPTRRGDPEAGREQRVADLRLVLTIRGLRSLVTVWRRKPRGSARAGGRRAKGGGAAIYDGTTHPTMPISVPGNPSRLRGHRWPRQGKS